MPELLICPKCGSHNYFKAHSKRERKCYWFLCDHKFKLSDRLYALKKASRKSFRKLALEIDVKQRTFENWTTGRVVPGAENTTKIEGLFLKYFSKKSPDDFVAE